MFAEPTRIREPVQRRSQQSTERMLDAALNILERDGLDGLTIAAVAREAGVGVGTIYHRFTDRDGLLHAAEDRFMTRIEQKWQRVSAAVRSLDNDEFLHYILLGSTESFIARRRTFHAFVVTFNDDPVLRSRFTQTGRLVGAFVVEALMERFGCSRAAADTAFRIMFNDGTVEVLFSAAEVEPEPVPLDQRIRFIKSAVSAMLTADAEQHRT